MDSFGWLIALHSTLEAEPVHSSPGRVRRPNSGLVFARCVFSAPSAPDGPSIAPLPKECRSVLQHLFLDSTRIGPILCRHEVVERALVDTGSSDCELREGLLRRLPELPIVERAAADSDMEDLRHHLK